jgi:hypothetical protein
VEKNSQLNKPAFVLGNGKSRLALKLDKLKLQGTMYGCNALYREFDPDYLICVDVKMVNEVIATGYHENHAVWTNPNRGITASHNINYFSPHKGWSSGPTALWFACSQGYSEIYIFGFDYLGIEGKFNNVYSDTFNYKKSEDSATFYGNWLSQTERTIKEFPQIQFYRIIESGAFIPDKLTCTNLEHMNYERFEEKFNGTTYTSQILQKTSI